MERTMCTYCGQEGHRASHCPWRPAKLFTGLALVAALVGCGKKSDHQADWSREETHRLGVGFTAVEFRLRDGTRCVAVSAGGVACDWGPR